jgi:YcaO-like protein with predicted kinase domain
MTGTTAPPRASKGHRAGTHRTVSPEETLRRILPVIGAMGITRVANVTGLDVIGLPVVAVTRPNSRSISVAQGKGLDLAAAKVSGIMESIENYHAERIQKPLVFASWRSLAARGPTLDLSRLPRLAGSALHPDDRMLWIEGHDALGRKRVMLPFELVHTDYVVPLPTGSGAFQMSDSGIASGNHPLEAMSHGICELVERDAVTLWHFLDAPAKQSRRVDLGTVDDPSCRFVLDAFAQASVGVAVWDVTSDLGIASFFCTLIEPLNAWRPLGPASGSGCHPSREVALLRALTEAAQTRLTVIAGARDDVGLTKYAQAADGNRLVEAHRLFNLTPERRFDSIGTFNSDSFEDDLAWELGRLRSAGIDEVAVVDLTLPEFEIPVVRVVIPGLEGMSDVPGFTPGARLKCLAAEGQA